MRVRNIFICSGEVFCASSRMMKARDSVRPRMKASGAISMQPRSNSFGHAVEAHQVVERVVQRAQIRIHLLGQIAGQEAETLASLHRRPREHDALHVLALEGIHRAGHRQVGLAGASRANAESDVVLLDLAQVVHLARRAAMQLTLAGQQGRRRLVGLGQVA